MIKLFSVFTDIIESSLMAWGQTFQPDIFFGLGGSRSIQVAWVLVFLSAVVLTFYVLRQKPEPKSKDSTLEQVRAQWAKQAIMIGLFAMFVAGLPVWFMDREVILNHLYDRYTLPFMLGACIFLVGLIQMIMKTRLQRIIVLSILIGLAAAFHFRNANHFREDWSLQKDFFWQLSWRAPGLKPGTSILIDESTFLFQADYALAAPLNFIYAPHHSSPQLEYWCFYLPRSLVRTSPKVKGRYRLADGVPLRRVLHSISFAGSTSNSLVIWFSPPSCLRVLDPLCDELPHLPASVRLAQRYSHVDRIIMNPGSETSPPNEIFGAEPEHCWCYYFQKADLARQMGNWRKVVQIGEEARRLGFEPQDATEWLPFIEGYINVRRYDRAREIAGLAFEAMPTVMSSALRLLCERLEKVETQDPARKAFISNFKAELSRGPL